MQIGSSFVTSLEAVPRLQAEDQAPEASAGVCKTLCVARFRFEKTKLPVSELLGCGSVVRARQDVEVIFSAICLNSCTHCSQPNCAKKTLVMFKNWPR